MAHAETALQRMDKMLAGTTLVHYRADNYSPDAARTYVVLGAPRGGTSMLAGALELLGIPMGSTNSQHEDPVFHDEKNIERMVATIAQRNESLQYWGWKLPNTIYYYDQLAAFVRNPIFLAVYRNPFDIFLSAARRAGGLDESHFNAPAYHYAAMHQLIHRHPEVPVQAVSYDLACEHVEAFVTELTATLPFPVSPDSIARCTSFIDRSRGYTKL